MASQNTLQTFIGGLSGPLSPLPKSPSSLYTDPILQEILSRNDIDPTFSDSLRSQLDFAAEIYHFRTSRQNSLNGKQIRKTLEKIEEDARKLERGLMDLHPKILRYCQSAERNLRGTVKDHPGTIEEIRQSLVFLRQLCGKANAISDLELAGRKPHNSVYVWVKMVGDIWVNTLNRPFTFDTHQSEAISAVGQFLTDCAKPLDPDLIPKISSQMRRYKADIM